MKKTIALIAAALATLTCASMASAIELQLGNFGMKYSDHTYSDFNYNTIFGGGGGLPSHPGQGATPSGNVWGIAALTSIHGLDDNNPENNSLTIPSYYNPGSDGKFQYAVYGGLTYLSDTGAVPGSIRLGATASGSYLKIYETTFGAVYNSSRLAGPNVASGGAFGTFGQNIIFGPDGVLGGGDDSTLLIDAVFSPGTLAYYDLGFVAGELELITLSSSVTGSAEAYLDVIGGTLFDQIKKGIFPVALPGAPDRADLKIISDLTADFDTTSGTWRSAWTNTSQDPITGEVVPEPSTIMLLGLGLLGVAGFGYRKSKG